MTAKLVLLGVRSGELTREECVEYFEQEHVPLLKELSGLERVRSGVPTDLKVVGAPGLSGPATYDVVIELQFEGLEAMQAAFRGQAGRRILKDAGRFLDLEESVVVSINEETLQYRSIPKTI